MARLSRSSICGARGELLAKPDVRAVALEPRMPGCEQRGASELFCNTPELQKADAAMSAAYFKLLRKTTDRTLMKH